MFKNLLAFYKSQEVVTFWSVMLCAFSALLIILLLIIHLQSLPSQLPLYYSLPWGEKQLATLPEFVFLPGTIIFISLVNLVISWHLHSSQIVVKRILSVTSLTLALMILITALKILYTFI